MADGSGAPWVLSSPRVSKPEGKDSERLRPDLIDARLYSGNRISPIGLWHVDARHPQLDILDRVIRAIRERIPTDDVEITITAQQIGRDIASDEESVARAFEQLLSFGSGFFNQAHGPASAGGEGFDRIQFSKGDLFDYYRQYEGMDDLLERAYSRRGKDLYATEGAAPVNKSADSIRTAADEATPTAYDTTVKKLKNRRIVVWILIVSAVVIGAANFWTRFIRF